MPEPSQGPNELRGREVPLPGDAASDVEVAWGGADAVPETPNAAPSGASLEGANAREREHGIMAMRQNIRTGRWLLAVLSVVFVIGLAGWVFWFFYW